MDQSKIGKFICENRKRKGLTQSQLAEKLYITDRAVSKWETGKALPDSSIMLELCRLLDITVVDLLNGEVVDLNDKNKDIEQQLVELIKIKEQKDRKLLSLEWLIVVQSLLILFIPIIIAWVLPMKEWQQIVMIFSGFIPCLIGIGFAVKIEQIAGYYECQNCKNRYIPSYWAVIFAPHMGRTRKLKCPKCAEKTWNKKVISKE